MAKALKLKELESYLEDVDVFEAPKVVLEQYPTTPHLAGDSFFSIYYDSLKWSLHLYLRVSPNI